MKVIDIESSNACNQRCEKRRTIEVAIKSERLKIRVGHITNSLIKSIVKSKESIYRFITTTNKLIQTKNQPIVHFSKGFVCVVGSLRLT